MANATNSTLKLEAYINSVRGLYTFYIAFNCVLCVLGTLVNVWFAGSILTSRNLRVSLRNQLLCNLAISHLIQTLFVCPAEVADTIDLINPPWRKEIYCNAIAVWSILGHVQSGLDDWLVVFLVATFLLNSLKVDLRAKLSSGGEKACKCLMHLFPWALICTVTVVSIVVVFGSRYCHHVTYRNVWLFETLYTVLPNGVSLLLLILLYVLKRRQPAGGSRTVGQETDETDGPLAYILTMAVIVFCEANSLLMVFEWKAGNSTPNRTAIWATMASYSRVIIALFPFLLFPDIRERLAVWRPWKRDSAPAGIDLTTAYKNEA